MGSFNGDFNNDFDVYFDITSDAIIGIIEGVPFSEQLVATQAAIWSVVSGTLPTGITLSSGGLISGTTTVIGNSNITIRATSNVGSYIDEVEFLFRVTASTGGALWRRRSSVYNFRLLGVR